MTDHTGAPGPQLPDFSGGGRAGASPLPELSSGGGAGGSGGGGGKGLFPVRGDGERRVAHVERLVALL
ncbi:hypothetical protein [Brachybacterium sp.]|uniref:hypothetical protein n=1 Tax=unclassified Brachybacterium TaxID=2623841 RepID=UPI003F8F58CF